MSEQVTNAQTAVSDAVESIQPSQEQTQDTTEQAEGQEVSSAAPDQAKAQLEALAKDPKASKAEKKAAKNLLKKLTLKVDGEEFEEELPFEIPNDPKAIEYMKRELQLAKMGQKRAQTAANLEREVLQFVEDLRKNPRKALSDPAIGLDLKKLAAQIIEEEIENSKKSPEQLKAEQLEAELKAMKEDREREKQTREQQEFERLKEQEYERIDMLMSQALEKSDLPKTPAVVRKMAEYMSIGLQAGKDVSPADVLPIVREEIINDYQQLLNSLPDEEVEKFIGKDRINSIRKKSIAKAKQAAANPALKAPSKATDTGKVTKEQKEAEKKQSFKDYFKF